MQKEEDQFRQFLEESKSGFRLGRGRYSRVLYHGGGRIPLTNRWMGGHVVGAVVYLKSFSRIHVDLMRGDEKSPTLQNLLYRFTEATGIPANAQAFSELAEEIDTLFVT